MLFRYFDGERMRAIDPLQAHYALNSHPKWNWDNAPLIDEGDPEQQKIAVEAVCDVFGVSCYDDSTGKGLVSVEILGILYAFDAYCQAVKKKFSPGQTSPRPTESSVSHSVVVPPETTNSCSV